MDAGLGYALLPAVQVSHTGTHTAVPYADAPHARYGAYHRAGAQDAPVQRFLELAARAY